MCANGAPITPTLNDSIYWVWSDSFIDAGWATRHLTANPLDIGRKPLTCTS